MDILFRGEEAQLERMLVSAINGYILLTLSIKLLFLSGFITERV
jgi:hypothetical protein